MTVAADAIVGAVAVVVVAVVVVVVVGRLAPRIDVHTAIRIANTVVFHRRR